MSPAMMNAGFYVDVRRGERTLLLAGPYRTHAEALANYETFRKKAVDYGDPKSWFDAYGTCRLQQHSRLPRGVFTPADFFGPPDGYVR